MCQELLEISHIYMQHYFMYPAKVILLFWFFLLFFFFLLLLGSKAWSLQGDILHFPVSSLPPFSSFLCPQQTGAEYRKPMEMVLCLRNKFYIKSGWCLWESKHCYGARFWVVPSLSVPCMNCRTRDTDRDCFGTTDSGGGDYWTLPHSS